jgi:hypothetical protein
MPQEREATDNIHFSRLMVLEKVLRTNPDVSSAPPELMEENGTIGPIT